LVEVIFSLRVPSFAVDEGKSGGFTDQILQFVGELNSKNASVVRVKRLGAG
jgi:hypothetical protein